MPLGMKLCPGIVNLSDGERRKGGMYMEGMVLGFFGGYVATK